jgi:plasmid stabilization system protein ParE
MAVVHWTRAARSALDEIVRMRRQNAGVMSARILYERIRNQTDRLADFPELGRRVSNDPGNDLRILIVSGYRIAYRIEADQIFIVFIAHGRSSLLTADDADDMDSDG